MPEAKKATLKQMLSAAVNAALAQRPDLELVKLADGAHDNWSYLGQLAPQAARSTEVVDFFHAAEQLKRMPPTVRTARGAEFSTRGIVTCCGMRQVASSG